MSFFLKLYKDDGIQLPEDECWKKLSRLTLLSICHYFCPILCCKAFLIWARKQWKKRRRWNIMCNLVKCRRVREKARILLACHKPFPAGLSFARFMTYTATMQHSTCYTSTEDIQYFKLFYLRHSCDFYLIIMAYRDLFWNRVLILFRVYENWILI